jgi:nucleotide-binding universal stress UspA family protein
MYQHLLVPLKRDRSDEAVIEHAGSLARLTGGRLTLVHVVHSHSRDESVYLEEQAREYLDGWVQRLSALGVTAVGRVAQGEPADAITALARESEADLIIMATHGHSEMRHVFVGSVTEEVVRNGDLPVLLVRPAPD